MFLNKGKEKIIAFFGDIHPNILKKLDIKTEALVGFEIFLDNIKQPKNLLKIKRHNINFLIFKSLRGILLSF